MRLTNFGYNALVSIWLIPKLVGALWGNSHSTGNMSDFYAGAAALCGALLAYAVWSAYQSYGQTATRHEAQQRVTDHNDVAVLSFENLGAWKWIYCLLIGVIAIASAISDYLTNRSTEGLLATFFLIYAFIDILIAVVSLRQFWAIKRGQIVELSNKASSSMFQR